MTVTGSDDEGISQHVEDTDGIPDGESEDIYREDLDYGLIAVLKSEMDGDIDVNIFERTPNGNVENVYSSSHPNDFPKKKQIHREIGNQVKGSVQFTEAEYAKVEVEDFFERLHKDSSTVDLKHPEVSTILESTRSVQIWDGDPATITVKIDWNDSIGVLEFQQDEFTTDSPRAFKNKFFGAFFKTPKLGKDEWMAIRDVWEQRKTIVGETGVDDDKLVATEVLEMLKRRVDPTTDRDALSNGKDKALFDGGNEQGFGGLTVDEDVLWVQSSLIKTAIESAGETRQELQMVSRKLQEMRAMYGSPTTIRAGSEGVPQRFWPLDPVMVAVSEEFIEDAEDADDDSDDNDEGSDPGDGDDPGDDPDDGNETDGDDGDGDDDDGGEGAVAETADGDSSGPRSINADPDAEEGFTAADLEADADESDDVDAGDTDTSDARARRPPAARKPSDSKPAGDGSPADVAAEINAIEDGPQDGDPMTDGGVPTAPAGGDSPDGPVDHADPFDVAEWEHVNEYDGSTDVYRVFGAPGAGKTRELKRAIHREVHEFDKSHDDILFCTFTRSGRAEAEDDLLRIFDPTDDETEDAVKRRAKTVHGATLRAVVEADLITTPEDVHLSDVILYNQATDTGFYQDFADEYDLPFSEDITNPIRMTREEIEEQKAANAIFSLYSWLKLERLDLKQFPRAPVNCPLGQRKTYEMLQAWEEWKQTGYDYEVYEHVDYIDLAIENGVTPDASVLLLDEFQDLSPQEYALFQVWRDSGVIDRIYIAGDRLQSIYSFRGGDPENFVETPVTYEKSVGESWRCPEPVVDAARTVIERGPGDDPDDFSAKFDSGVAERVSLPDSYSLAESVRESVKAPSADEDYRQVYLLARTNYQVGRICSALNEGGVPFSGVTDNMNPWDGELVCALHVLRALRDDEPVPAEPLDYLLDGRVSAHEKRTTNLRLQVGQGDADTYPTTAVWAAFTDCDTLEEIAGKLDATEYQHEMLEAAIDTDAPINPKYVKVGTIHASKGSEAPVVYLFNSGSKRIFESTMADESRQAEEHRVAYVGATRASNELYVVDDYFDDTYTLAGVPGGASL